MRWPCHRTTGSVCVCVRVRAADVAVPHAAHEVVGGCCHNRRRCNDHYNYYHCISTFELLLLLICVVSLKFHDFDQLYRITARAYTWIISNIDMHIQQYIACDDPYLTLRYCEIVHLHQFRIDNR